MSGADEIIKLNVRHEHMYYVAGLAQGVERDDPADPTTACMWFYIVKACVGCDAYYCIKVDTDRTREEVER